MRIPAGMTPSQLGQAHAVAGPLAPPLWWWRVFPGEPSRVSEARSWVARLFLGCGPVDDLLIVATELAANAVTHTRSGEPGGRFTVEVAWTPRSARVVVGDQGSDEVPATAVIAGDPDAYLENGRGLMLVSALSAAWGLAGDASGRWVWADLDWQSRSGPSPAAIADSTYAEMQFAALRCRYPRTATWYGQQSGQWHASLAGVHDGDGILNAPSPLALAAMLAARYLTAPASDPATS